MSAANSAVQCAGSGNYCEVINQTLFSIPIYQVFTALRVV